MCSPQLLKAMRISLRIKSALKCLTETHLISLVPFHCIAAKLNLW